MPFDFAGSRKQAESDGILGSGDYLKIKEGDNRLRLMSECVAHPGEYNGKPNFKWLCYVIDRKDQKVKPFFMPHIIYKALEALQMNEEYAFADVPMPYDVTVNAVGAGTKEVKYTVLPARKETSITALEHQAFAEMKPIQELEALLREKNKQKAKNEPPPPQKPYREPEQVHQDDGPVEEDDPLPF